MGQGWWDRAEGSGVTIQSLGFLRKLIIVTPARNPADKLRLLKTGVMHFFP